MEDRIDKIAGLCERIDERTQNMKDDAERTAEHLEKLITQEREDRQSDVKALRSELKRLPSIISGAVSATIAGLAHVLGMGGQS